MKSVEVLENGALVVVREGIDRALALDLQAEWLEVLPDVKRHLIYGGRGDASEMFFCEGFSVNEVCSGSQIFPPSYNGLPATKGILEMFGFDLKPDARVTVNHQAPHTAQPFHIDRALEDDLAIVIHGGDDGAFDYAPAVNNKVDAEARHQTVEKLRAGDVVFHHRPYIFHRGRNTGEQPRITTVLHTNL